MFQSTHSRGVRHHLALILLYPDLFQSTHSRGVRRKILPIHRGNTKVSIHALTRSATSGVFIQIFTYRSFNPRTHEECDKHQRKLQEKQQVSIHALTRSATLLRLLVWFSRHLFQSTHSRGVRQCFSRNEKVFEMFQSTHSRGVRPVANQLSEMLTMFQSTHSRGVRRK